jgi:hypothetical protein
LRRSSCLSCSWWLARDRTRARWCGHTATSNRAFVSTSPIAGPRTSSSSASGPSSDSSHDQSSSSPARGYGLGAKRFGQIGCCFVRAHLMRMLIRSRASARRLPRAGCRSSSRGFIIAQVSCNGLRLPASPTYAERSHADFGSEWEEGAATPGRRPSPVLEGAVCCSDAEGEGRHYATPALPVHDSLSLTVKNHPKNNVK